MSTKTASRSQPGSSSSHKKSKTSSTKNKTKSTANNSRNSNDSNQQDVGEINRSLLSSFVEVFRSTEFQQHEELKIVNAKLDIPCLLNWIVSEGSANTAGKSPMSTIYKICQVKVDRLKEKREATETKITEESNHTPRAMLDTNQVRQILRAASAIYIYQRDDNRIYELFNKTFINGSSSTKLIIGTLYLTSITGTRKKSKLIHSSPSKLEAFLYFHAIRVYERAKFSVQVSHGNKIGFILQKWLIVGEDSYLL